MKNKKFLVLYIILLIIVFAILGYYLYNKYYCYTEVIAVDNSFKVTVPNRINYKIKETSDENYTLDFYSIKDEMFFYSNVIDKQSEIDLKEVVTTEKNNLSSNLSNVNIVSDVTESNINNYKVCKYSYTYTDSSYGNDLYAEVAWIETKSKIYILDLEVITKNM